MTTKLTPEELALIREHGIADEAAARYVRFFPDRTAELTERGRAYYRAAYILHGLDPAVFDAERTTFEDLFAAVLHLKRLRRAAAFGISFAGHDAEEARAIVETLHASTNEQLLARIAGRDACEGVGPNVIPVDFTRRCRCAA